ncbi:MAG: hypothetical protein JWN35_2907 [Frankiales bacterium]|nr:hypothetical protein [Frankiales bacterium]
MAVGVLPVPVTDTGLLEAAVDRLQDRGSAELDPLSALERLRAVLVQTARLQAVGLDGVRDLDARELFALDGAGSAAGWLRAQRVGGEAGLVTLARRLGTRPVVLGALADGTLDMRAGQKVCAALEQVPAEIDEPTLRAVLTDGVGQVFDELSGGSADPQDSARLRALAVQAGRATAAMPSARLEPAFTFLAHRLPGGVLARVLQDLVDALLPAQLDERYDNTDEEQYLELERVLDGGWHVRGFLRPEDGAALDAELTRRMGSDPDDPDRPRTPIQRRAAVLGQLARDSHGAHETSCDRPAADISIVVRDTTLAGQPGALPARLSDGTRLSLAAVRRLGCDGRISAVVLDALGRAIGASGSHRNATRRERRALDAQWGGCAVDGCAKPAAQTRPHHVIPWWLSRRTRLADLVPLCDSNHHDIHEGRRTLRLRDGRHINPTGWADGPAP